MKNLPKILMIVSVLTGIILVVNMFFNDSLHTLIVSSEYCRDARYTIISMITSPDFNDYPYSVIELPFRILPLIGTLMVAAATITSIFYKNRKCVIATIVLIIIAMLIFFIAYVGLGQQFTYGDTETWFRSYAGYGGIAASFLIGYLNIASNNAYRKENGLLKPWEKW